MAKRSKSSLLDDLINISVATPLWLNLLVAGSLFFVLRWYSGGSVPSFPVVHSVRDLGTSSADYMLKTAAYFAQFVLPSIFVFGGLAGWLGQTNKARRYRRIVQANNVGAAIRGLSWREFEVMVGEALRRQGYTVEETKPGPDGGVDLVLMMRGEKYLVQCKQWKAQKVGVQVVRELYGVMAAEGAVGGFVVTSGAFTAEAATFAAGTNVELVDGVRLSRWFRAQGDGTVKEHPHCPRCGDLMTPRQPRSGGKIFWGCTRFPGCRGTRSIC